MKPIASATLYRTKEAAIEAFNYLKDRVREVSLVRDRIIIVRM